MKSVPANTMLSVEMIRNGVEIGLFGQRMMEGSIEDRNLRNIFSKEIASRKNAFHIVRIVKRSQVDALLDTLEHAIIDQHRFFERLSTMDDTVSDGVDIGSALDL